MTDWQTIDSAPTDGTWVLLTGGKINYGWDCSDQPRCVVGQHTRNSKEPWQFAWYDSGYYGVYENPTHWQPQPSPPA